MIPPARRSHVPPFYVMEVLKAARRRERAGGDVLHLEVGQPATGAPLIVRETAKRAIDHDLLRYTDADGNAALRETICSWYTAEHGLRVAPERIVITTGASGACVLVFLASFDVADRVAVARPSYPCYRNMLNAFGVEVVDLPVGAGTRFQPTAAMVETAHHSTPGGLQGLVLASPSNPTGTMVAPDEMAAIADVCRRHRIRLVVDEIYHGISYDTPAVSVLASEPKAVVINSFSKFFSMTGWRLGWLVVPDELVEPVERLAQNLTVAPPTLAQIAAVDAFSPTALTELRTHVDRYARNRRVLCDGLTAAGFSGFVEPDGAFYLWCAIDELIVRGITGSAVELCAEWLEELDVAVTPGIDFDPVDGDRAIRFSFAGSEADVATAVGRITAWSKRSGLT